MRKKMNPRKDVETRIGNVPPYRAINAKQEFTQSVGSSNLCYLSSRRPLPARFPLLQMAQCTLCITVLTSSWLQLRKAAGAGEKESVETDEGRTLK